MAYTTKLDFLTTELMETAKADKATAMVAVGDEGREAHLAYTGDSIAVMLYIYSFLTQISEKDNVPVEKLLKLLKRMHKINKKEALIESVENAE